MPSKISLTPIFMVAFIGALGYSIVLPFLVVVVTQMGGNAFVYGIVGATYSAFQLVGAPILGRWSDKFGRRRVLLLSQVGTLISWLVFLVALSLPMVALWDSVGPEGRTTLLTLPLLVLFSARALDGLTGGNVSVANAYLADVTAEDERDKMFGKMAVATNLGFIIGPVISGLLGATALGASLPVLLAIGISIAATAVIALKLPESNPCAISSLPQKSVSKVFGQEQSDCFEHTSEGNLGFRDALEKPGISFLLALYFLIFLCFNIFYVAFPIHAIETLGWSSKELGLFFSFLGLTTVVVQGPLLSRVSGKISEAKLVVLGALFLSGAFFSLTSMENGWLYFGAALFSLGNGLQWPSFLSVLSKTAGSRLQGIVQGFGGSVGSLASIVGLILGGLVYSSIGGSVFVASSGLMLLIGLVATKLAQMPKG